jgi:hypothetical protein
MLSAYAYQRGVSLLLAIEREVERDPELTSEMRPHDLQAVRLEIVNKALAQAAFASAAPARRQPKTHESRDHHPRRHRPG